MLIYIRKNLTIAIHADFFSKINMANHADLYSKNITKAIHADFFSKINMASHAAFYHKLTWPAMLIFTQKLT